MRRTRRPPRESIKGGCTRSRQRQHQLARHRVSDTQAAAQIFEIGAEGVEHAGAVISAAANGLDNVKALVFVAAFAPDLGESALGLTGKFPGSTLPPTLAPAVKLADGSEDLYIQQDKFPEQFAADVPLAQAKAMAATQRPIKAAALARAT